MTTMTFRVFLCEIVFIGEDFSLFRRMTSITFEPGSVPALNPRESIQTNMRPVVSVHIGSGYSVPVIKLVAYQNDHATEFVKKKKVDAIQCCTEMNKVG
jgi:hypothetical protein